MGKQSTLGKFWELPKGMPPPPKVQADLNSMWGGKGKEQGGGSGSGKDEVNGGEKEEKGEGSSSKSKSSESAKKSNKRPIVDSDDDDETIPTNANPSNGKPSSTDKSSSPPKKKAKIDIGDSVDEIAEQVKRVAEAQVGEIKVAPGAKADGSVVGSPAKNKPAHSFFSKPAPAPPPVAAASSSSAASSSKAKTDAKPARKGKPDPDDDDDAEDDLDADGDYNMSSSKPTKPTNGKSKQISPFPKDDEGASPAAEEAEAEEEEINDEADKKEMNDAALKLAGSYASSYADIERKGPTWKEGAPVPYKALTDCFEQIDQTTKRIAISNFLTQFLLKVAMNPGKEGKDLIRVVYLCINRLCPDYMGVELGIGESLIVKAIAQSTARKPADIKTDLRKVGDLGLVAEQSKSKQKTLAMPSALTVEGVFKILENIAKAQGKDSQNRKVGFIQKLLTSCQGSETRFIIRSLEGKLRIGLAEKTLVTALAHAIVLKEVGRKKLSQGELAERLVRGAEVVKQVYSELPSYDAVVPALLTHGISGLRAACKLTPGVPLKPMLAKPTKAIGEVLDKFEGKEFTCEYKYDGERAQIHLMENGQFVIFSRNSENMSAKYPDLVESMPRCLGPNVKSFVMDSEAVAYDLPTKKLLPFQDLSRRKRKDVRTEDITVRVHVFAFDLLYLNGEPLLEKTLKERREILRENFIPVEGEFGFAKSSDGSTSEQIAEFLDESIKDGCEGLMVKRLTEDAAMYQPSRRSQHWLKLKKDYLSGVGDSMDLCVVGGYYGKGKRTNVYGALLLACFDADSEQWQTATKIGTGFSEQVLIDLYETLKPLELETKRSDIVADMSKVPDVWFEPKVVMEVLCADLSLSPVYKAAAGAIDSRGISLRFPRFIRLRDDKDADDITSSEQIAEFYQNQALAAGKGDGGGGDDW